MAIPWLKIDNSHGLFLQSQYSKPNLPNQYVIFISIVFNVSILTKFLILNKRAFALFSILLQYHENYASSLDLHQFNTKIFHR